MTSDRYAGSSPVDRSVIPRRREVFAFECNVRGKQWQKTINHWTAGKARYEYLLDVRDAWPEVTFADVTVRKIGPAHTSEAFKRTAQYRGVPDLQCGTRVRVGKACGVIVAHNDCANFDVLFDEDSPEFAGLTLNVHPMEMRIEGHNAEVTGLGLERAHDER